MTTLERLSRVLNDFGVSADALRPETRLDALNIDSLALVEILFRIEDEFGIVIAQDQAKPATMPQTVGALVALIDSAPVAGTRNAGGAGARQPD